MPLEPNACIRLCHGQHESCSTQAARVVSRTSCMQGVRGDVVLEKCMSKDYMTQCHLPNSVCSAARRPHLPAQARSSTPSGDGFACEASCLALPPSLPSLLPICATICTQSTIVHHDTHVAWQVHAVADLRSGTSTCVVLSQTHRNSECNVALAWTHA